MSITGGSVTFEQSRKLAEYENRKVSITFNVTEEKGAEDEVKAALAFAHALVFRALGLTEPGDALPASDTSEKPKRGRPPKVATAPVEVKSDPAAMVEAPQIRTNPENRTDPAAMVEDASLFEGTTEVVKVITEIDVMSAITRKNAALQMNLGQEAPVRIRGLIGKYAKSAKDIPADKRQSFLDDLAALAA